MCFKCIQYHIYNQHFRFLSIPTPGIFFADAVKGKKKSSPKKGEARTGEKSASKRKKFSKDKNSKLVDTVYLEHYI